MFPEPGELIVCGGKKPWNEELDSKPSSANSSVTLGWLMQFAKLVHNDNNNPAYIMTVK